MPHTELSTSENTFHFPILFKAGGFVLLSLFFLLFYFLSVHLMGIFGLVFFFLIAGIASFMGIEFFTVFFLVSLFLQNALVALVTTTDNPSEIFQFNMCLATSFIITCLFSVYGGLSWLDLRKTLPPENTVLLRWAILFSLVSLIYCGPGMITSDLKSVLTYLRVYLGAIMFLCIGVAAGYKVPSGFLINVIRVLAAILVIWGFAELFFSRELLGFFNVLYYIRMKFLGAPHIIENLDMIIQPQPYLNLSGQFGLELKLPRLEGPHIHAISYAYELTFCGLICFMYRHWILATACFIVLTVVGAKGAMVETAASLLFYLFYHLFRRPRLLLWVVALFVGVYVTGVVYYGLASADFHILGLIGSIHGFISNPVGRGVGVGGNLSTQGLEDATLGAFQRFQQQGSADFALESGFGVMLYQLGAATIVFLLFYHYLFKNIWDKVTQENADTHMIILPLALIFTLMNSIFQEEAFSPASIGLWLFFSGFFLTSHWREKTSVMH